ncbi:conserved Plasmodium protein, unknown function [Plasmodium ovale wallikeri]|uniref:Uncharacterized protein n=1 Tax=Plasmodium ovale wallikeri TaxID=864142 RepID=A0A1A8YP90_PLAOA|nr:conserved Plasmodium protein, unknown function [Plasmodium ovale wallikeri]
MVGNVKQLTQFLPFYALLIFLVFNIILSESNSPFCDISTGAIKYFNCYSMNSVRCVRTNKLGKEYRNCKCKNFDTNNGKKKKKFTQNEPVVRRITLCKSKQGKKEDIKNMLKSETNRYVIAKHGKNNKNIYQFLLHNNFPTSNNFHIKSPLKSYKTNVANFLLVKKDGSPLSSNNSRHSSHWSKVDKIHWSNTRKCFSLYAMSTRDTSIGDSTATVATVTLPVERDDNNTLLRNNRNVSSVEKDNAKECCKQEGETKKRKRILSEASKNSMREKLRLIMLNKWKDVEFRKKMIRSFKKRGLEHNKKISEAVKKKWQNDKDYKLKTLEGQRKYFLRRYKNSRVTFTSDETRKKISKSMKQYWMNKNKCNPPSVNNLQSLVKKKKKHKKVWENIYSLILNQKLDDFNSYQTFHHNLSINLQAALN